MHKKYFLAVRVSLTSFLIFSKVCKSSYSTILLEYKSNSHWKKAPISPAQKKDYVSTLVDFFLFLLWTIFHEIWPRSNNTQSRERKKYFILVAASWVCSLVLLQLTLGVWRTRIEEVRKNSVSCFENWEIWCFMHLVFFSRVWSFYNLMQEKCLPVCYVIIGKLWVFSVLALL